MKKIFYLFLVLVLTFGAVNAAETKMNPNDIKTINQYEKYMEQELFDKTPTAFSYVKRQIIYKVDVTPDGKLSNYQLVQSSGSDKYDTKVKDAVLASNLPSFPKNANLKKITFTYDVEKRMNVKIPVSIPVKVPSLKF